MKPTPVLLMARELNLGGTERQLTEIARSLDRSSFEPHVGCLREAGMRGEELRASGVPVARFPADSFRSPSLIGGIRKLGAYIREHGIEIVHTFDVPMNLFGVPVARMYRAPRVISSRRAHRDLALGARGPLLRLVDRIADAVVVNCSSVRRELVEEEGLEERRIHLCYNGIDTAIFRPAPAVRGSGCLVIGVVCALRLEKDLGTLVRAFAEIRRVRPGLKLRIVGGGPEREPLEKLGAALGLGDDFILEPATNRVADKLHSIDIFVLPSLSEALSNSLMEAMACGCAVIASRVGGNPELVSHGETGLLFDPGDVGGLAAALRKAIENDELRSRMAEAAAHSIRTNFSLEVSARRMADIYRTVLEGA